MHAGLLVGSLTVHTLRCFWPRPSLHMDEPRRLQLPSWLVMSTAPHPSPNSMHVPANSPDNLSGIVLACK